MMCEIHVDGREGVRACEASTMASVSLLLKSLSAPKTGGRKSLAAL